MHLSDITPDHVTAATQQVLETVTRFTDEAVAAPSLCTGWTRGHVLSHLARNADALGRVCAVAVTGEPGTMYDTVESRDADINAGAGRSAAALAADVRDSAADFLPLLEQVGPAHAEVMVERVPGGPQIPVGIVGYLRLRELTYHHVDLDAGYTFADADPEVVRLFLDDAVRRLDGDQGAPGLAIRTDDGGEWTVGDGATTVTGSQADVLLWLARGVTDDVAFDGPTPTLPFGG